MEVLRIGDLSNPIIERGDIVFEVVPVEGDSSNKLISGELFFDIEVSLAEEKTYYFLWFLAQDERDLTIEHDYLKIELQRCRCKEITYSGDSFVIACLIEYQDADIRVV